MLHSIVVANLIKPIFYHLKTPSDIRKPEVSDNFEGYRNVVLVWDGLIPHTNNASNLIKQIFHFYTPKSWENRTLLIISGCKKTEHWLKIGLHYILMLLVIWWNQSFISIPLKYQKATGFLIFSRCIEKRHKLKMA